MRLFSYFLTMRWLPTIATSPTGAQPGGRAPHAAVRGQTVEWRHVGDLQPLSSPLRSRPPLSPAFAFLGGFLPLGMVQPVASLPLPSATHSTRCRVLRTTPWGPFCGHRGCPSSAGKPRDLLGGGDCPGKEKALLKMGDLAGRWRINKKHKGSKQSPSCHRDMCSSEALAAHRWQMGLSPLVPTSGGTA